MYYYQEYLKDNLEKKVKRNKFYSLRAFARDLGVAPSTLSKIINGKTFPSSDLCKKILILLKIDPNEQHLFIKSLLKAKSENEFDDYANESFNYESIAVDVDHFNIISNWYHYAILELTYSEKFQNDPSWISLQLGISLKEAKDAIQRLLSIGLLKLEGKTLVKQNKKITTAQKNLTTPGLLTYQKQILDLSRKSLDEVEFQKRSTQGMTMAIDPTKIETARSMINRFMEDICDYLEAGEQKKVYQMSINLFPLEKVEL